MIDRRFFLGLAGAAVTTAACAAKPQKARLAICVVGGGIVGASIAMHCARAGADVTLLEKTAPGAGATSKSFAWINPYSSDPHYTALRLESYARWQKLDRPLGMGVTWGGYLDFTDRPAERGRMDAVSRILAADGHPTRALDAATLKQLSPALTPGDVVAATWSDLSGHVDPVHAVNCYLAAAKAAGAKVIYPAEVTAVEPTKTGQVTVVGAQGRLTCDRVVLANGVDAPALLAPLGYALRLSHQPGALVHTKPMAPVTPIVHAGPGEYCWKQMADGSFVGIEVSVPPPLPVHAEVRSHAIDFPPGIAEMHGQRILSKLSVYMPALAKAEYNFMTLGFRPVPSDEMPVVGPVPGVPGVSVCVTHSGVSLSAVLGEYMAGELIAGKNAPLLAPYRPSRALPIPRPI